MGLLKFLKDKGKNIFGGKPGNEAEAIKSEVEGALGDNVSNVAVKFENGVVSLQGEAKNQAAKEKAALIAGNVKGVENVNADGITVAGGAASDGEAQFYTIQSGDTLSAIAQKHYGDPNAYNKIFEANREVIGDPDKIYPGQQIRIPA